MISVNCSYEIVENGSFNNGYKGNMGQSFDKFLLLMWKNWTLQYRRPIQTIVEIIAPVLFSILLVVIRSLVDPELHETITYQPFCTVPIPIDIYGIELCPSYDSRSYGRKLSGRNAIFNNVTMVYSPKNPELDKAMSFFSMIFNIVGLNDSTQLVDYFVTNATNSTLAGIQFDDTYKDLKNLSDIKRLKVSLRFPSETRLKLDPFGINNWRTNLIFPVFQTPGPRAPNSTTGGGPNYFKEGFLAIQHFLTLALILARSGFSYPINGTGELVTWLLKNPVPVIYMNRYPCYQWYEDLLLTPLTSMLGIIIMLSFVYTCINTVKVITTEKEKQLKEAMKIMGLPNWLHWTAWFLKSFVFLFISAILMVVLLKVKWYTNTDFTVFTHADPLVMLLFLTFYVCSIVTFCFAISVFFSKANTAATIAGLGWFLSYAPYLFLQQQYDSLSLSTKLTASLGANSAMAFGFQVMLMYEGTGEGIQWSNIFTPNTPDDSLSLGLILIMFTIDSIIYLLIALYVEAIFPGEYGVPLPWYFPFTVSFWCGQSCYKGVEDFDVPDTNQSEFFEKEPKYLHAGIQIRNLRKVFGRKTAVRNLSLNMYEDQITVLLGHNGAGKTTTMSMLTGMYTPTSGTANINGYDIKTNMPGVRNSLGLCPQHNVIFDDLTVSEHLYFFSKLKGLSKNQIGAEIKKYVTLLELESKENSKASTLSGGMKRKLCVAMALCGNSKVVMLDEPTAGMDPSARRALWDLLQSQKEGRTMLLTTHFMDEADLLGDRIAIMAGGELQCCGSSFFLKKKYGAGYSLIMDKSANCDANQVTLLLKKYIPNIQIRSNIGSELTYLLAENQSSVFEAMLRDLENHSAGLGITGYGISLTTLEEVFMKVGADQGQEEVYNAGHEDEVVTISNGDIKVHIGVVSRYLNGFGLFKNQFLAMVIKKSLSTLRSWILLFIQIFIPVLFLIIAIIVARNQQNTGSLPAMPLTLDKFDNPVTLVENSGDGQYVNVYKSVLNDLNHEISESDNITKEIISLTETMPNRVRRRYVGGATFSKMFSLLNLDFPKITVWFNNDPYHTPGVALGLALNTVYRQLLNCSDCLIEFTNYPLPYTAQSKMNQIITGQSMGFQLAFNMGFSMAFVASFYILFPVREKVSKSKHLQFVSGAKVYIFWLTSFLCDMITYILTIIALLITLLCFQEDGFKTLADMARIFFIFFYFGWAFLPMLYLAAYLFKIPSTGFTRMTFFNIFTGVAAFLVVQVLNTQDLNLEHVGNMLHWIFLLFPHYSLATGLSESYKLFMYNNICNSFFELCLENHFTKEECLEATPAYTSICDGVDDEYYKWNAPGIGRNLLFSFFAGLFFFVLLLTIEYKIFARISYQIKQKYFPKYPVDVVDEDTDVVAEKEKIRNTHESDLFANYTLVLRDLTKYYKDFLAVNSICLGVKNYECFGLLGVNGAGKTTTFKMMTGDVKISHGNGFVNGYSIKNQLKQVQKQIGYCPQFDALLDDITARETIVMFSLLRGIHYSECNSVAENLARDFDFVRHLDKKVKQLSGGNKRKLSTAISLIGDPPVLYLDEPTTGMDVATKRYLWNTLCKVRDDGKCIILTSHSMEECEALCTRLAIMVNGHFKCLGSTQHLKNKFAEGYTLTLKIKKQSENGIMRLSDTAPVEDFIHQHFPTATLREKHQELLIYYITDRSIPWSKMFGILEGGKRRDLNIEDYCVGQSSLEQVFLTFTKHQH